jgi:MacB-like periplasmic core domain
LLSRLHAWARRIFLRSRTEREMREEMELHLERARERLMARGLSRAEAETEARREFGVVERLREEGRDARGGQWLDALRQDARFALRQFARRPLSAATIVLVLGLGIGGNVALFAVLHSFVTLPPPGIARDDALVRIRRLPVWGAGHRFASTFSQPEVQELMRHGDPFAGIGAWAHSAVVLDSATAQEGVAFFVTDDYFRVLGVRPVLGRGLAAASVNEASDLLVAVIGHALWDQRFGRSRAVLGRTLRVNGFPVTIVGVAPPRFEGVDDVGPPSRLWLPLGARAILEGREGAVASYDSTFLNVVARLRPGASIAQA